MVLQRSALSPSQSIFPSFLPMLAPWYVCPSNTCSRFGCAILQQQSSSIALKGVGQQQQQQAGGRAGAAGAAAAWVCTLGPSRPAPSARWITAGRLINGCLRPTAPLPSSASCSQPRSKSKPARRGRRRCSANLKNHPFFSAAPPAKTTPKQIKRAPVLRSPQHTLPMHHPQTTPLRLQGQPNTPSCSAGQRETAHATPGSVFSQGSGVGESRALHPAGGPPANCHPESPISPRLDALKWGRTVGGRPLPEDNTRRGRNAPARHIGSAGRHCCIPVPFRNSGSIAQQCSAVRTSRQESSLKPKPTLAQHSSKPANWGEAKPARP